MDFSQYVKIPGIDNGVIPLVAYFNSQGLKTSMSCEGHNRTNMSMFWISFDDSVTEQDIIAFQMRHLRTRYNVFSSCGRFSQRVYVGGATVVHQWCYFAATKEAADTDLYNWISDTEKEVIHNNSKRDFS